MSELPDPKVSPPEGVVAKSSLLVTPLLLGTNPNFEFMLGPGISDDLPVVDPFREPLATEKGSEQVVIFTQEQLAVVATHLQDFSILFENFRDFPAEVLQHHSYDLTMRFLLLLLTNLLPFGFNLLFFLLLLLQVLVHELNSFLLVGHRLAVLLLNQHVLEAEHLEANVVADLVRFVGSVHLELLARLMLEDGLALLVRALVLLAPLFMLPDQREEH